MTTYENGVANRQVTEIVEKQYISAQNIRVNVHLLQSGNTRGNHHKNVYRAFWGAGHWFSPESEAPVSIGFSIARPFTAGRAVIDIFRGRFTVLFLWL
jgi:hypothetical protein